MYHAWGKLSTLKQKGDSSLRSLLFQLSRLWMTYSCRADNWPQVFENTLALSAWPHVHHAHHLVIFMREDVAVPDVASGFVEGRLDAGYLAGQCRDHILGGILDILRRLWHSSTFCRIHNSESYAVGSWISSNGIVLYRWLCNQVGSIISWR